MCSWGQCCITCEKWGCSIILLEQTIFTSKHCKHNARTVGITPVKMGTSFTSGACDFEHISHHYKPTINLYNNLLLGWIHRLTWSPLHMVIPIFLKELEMWFFWPINLILVFQWQCFLIQVMGCNHYRIWSDATFSFVGCLLSLSITVNLVFASSVGTHSFHVLLMPV